MNQHVQNYTGDEVASLGQESSSSQSAQSREIAQVKGSILMAKTHPRHVTSAYNEILETCKRRTFAENALYAYPRGGTVVSGPSIRMAEALAQVWGNIDYGAQVLSTNHQKHESEVMAYAWDLEKNTVQRRVFAVSHKRKAKGRIETLTDPRDIYEHVMSQAMRRVRAAILSVIPSDIIEDAVEQCQKTKVGQNGRPLKEIIISLVNKFAEVGVTREEIEDRIGRSVDDLIHTEIAELGNIYNSIKEGVVKKSQFFGEPEPQNTPDAQSLTDKLKSKSKGEENEQS